MLANLAFIVATIGDVLVLTRRNLKAGGKELHFPHSLFGSYAWVSALILSAVWLGVAWNSPWMWAGVVAHAIPIGLMLRWGK